MPECRTLNRMNTLPFMEVHWRKNIFGEISEQFLRLSFNNHLDYVQVKVKTEEEF